MIFFVLFVCLFLYKKWVDFTIGDREKSCFFGELSPQIKRVEKTITMIIVY